MNSQPFEFEEGNEVEESVASLSREEIETKNELTVEIPYLVQQYSNMTNFSFSGAPFELMYQQSIQNIHSISPMLQGINNSFLPSDSEFQSSQIYSPIPQINVLNTPSQSISLSPNWTDKNAQLVPYSLHSQYEHSWSQNIPEISLDQFIPGQFLIPKSPSLMKKEREQKEARIKRKVKLISKKKPIEKPLILLKNVFFYLVLLDFYP